MTFARNATRRAAARRLESEGAEKGNILITFLFILLVLVLAIGMALEFGTAYGVQTMRDNDVAIARETTLGSGFGLQLKSSDDPAQDLAYEIHKSLRENGCGGEVKLYFYEVGPTGSFDTKSLDDRDATRAMAYVAELNSTYSPAVFAQAYFGTLKLCSRTYCTLTPYAPLKTYKPASADASYNSGKIQVVTYAAGDTVEAPSVTTELLEASSMNEVSAGASLRTLKAAVPEAIKQANELF